jgi:hypothetical protein
MFSAIQEELDNQKKRFADSEPKKKKFRLWGGKIDVWANVEIPRQ